MEPDNLGGIIPHRKRIHYIAPRLGPGDWLGSKLGGGLNPPHKLIGLSVFCMADVGRANCGELKNKFYMLRISVSTPFHVIHSTPQLNFWSAKKSIFNWVTCATVCTSPRPYWPSSCTTWSDHVTRAAVTQLKIYFLAIPKFDCGIEWIT